ncbi:MAG: universal stress protein [Hyphomicrobiales bacterium]|nr:universal stress protein [Hyphomicrobiales bacterium]
MPFASVFLAVVHDGSHDAPAAVDYAVDLAASKPGHLTAYVGVPRVVLPAEYPGISFGEMQAEIERKFDEEAAAWASDLRRRASAGGGAVDVELVKDVAVPMSDAFARAARVHDVAVIGAPKDASEFQALAIHRLLMDSGGPTIVVPAGWSHDSSAKKVVVAWDGSAQAARAARDALPLLARAAEVEVLSVTGDKRTPKNVGHAIAANLSRHCRSVRVTEVPAGDREPGIVVQEHAATTRAGLVVMGAYVHSRLREWAFGGATRTAIRDGKAPTLLSH